MTGFRNHRNKIKNHRRFGKMCADSIVCNRWGSPTMPALGSYWYEEGRDEERRQYINEHRARHGLPPIEEKP